MFKKRYIGIDIGGTKVEIVSALLKNNKIITEKVEKIKTGGGKDLLLRIEEAIKKMGVKKVSGIGIGVAGQVNTKKGVVLNALNIKDFKNIKIAAKLSKDLKHIFKYEEPKVKIDNDVNCFLRAEKVLGGLKEDSIIGLTFGTGIGGAFCLNGKSYKGANGLAGEIGHMTIKVNSKEGKGKSCHDLGCWEYFASGQAIEREYEKLTGKVKSAAEISQAVKKDIFAERVLKQVSYYMGVGLTNIVNIFDPEIIVIGGGLGENVAMRKKAIEVMKQRVLSKLKTKILVSKVENAVAKGAVLLARGCKV